jgi:hypothetical protein
LPFHPVFVPWPFQPGGRFPLQPLFCPWLNPDGILAAARLVPPLPPPPLRAKAGAVTPVAIATVAATMIAIILPGISPLSTVTVPSKRFAALLVPGGGYPGVRLGRTSVAMRMPLGHD